MGADVKLKTLQAHVACVLAKVQVVVLTVEGNEEGKGRGAHGIGEMPLKNLVWLLI